jgi:sarcosine oxidase subunit alpha
VSPTLGRPIALAMLRGGRARLGEPVTLHAEERTALATVVPTGFYDPAGERMHA